MKLFWCLLQVLASCCSPLTARRDQIPCSPCLTGCLSVLASAGDEHLYSNLKKQLFSSIRRGKKLSVDCWNMLLNAQAELEHAAHSHNVTVWSQKAPV